MPIITNYRIMFEPATTPDNEDFRSLLMLQPDYVRDFFRVPLAKIKEIERSGNQLEIHTHFENRSFRLTMTADSQITGIHQLLTNNCFFDSKPESLQLCFAFSQESQISEKYYI